MTRKEKTIRRVLLQRAECIDKLFESERSDLSPGDIEYFKGKRVGYMQAFSLVAESLESIKIELQ